MKIYTRTGDDGLTGLLGPGRVPKDDPRIEAYGAVDELNAMLGLARAARDLDVDLGERIETLQDELFNVGAALADPDPSGKFHRAITADHVARLEREIDALENELPPLTQFVLPAGGEAGSRLHLSRTICRRAERAVVGLGRVPGESVPSELLVYLNRLSDLLFVLARAANGRAGLADVPWRGLA